MKLFFGLDHDLYADFDWEKHTGYSSDELIFEFYHAEGEAGEIRIERPQQGWAFLTPGAPLNGIISESETGDPQDAIPIARARIVGMPDGMFDQTQWLTLSCSPANWLAVTNRYNIADGPVMAFARANLASMPETCPYLSDYDRDTPESYIVGRPVAYYTDPVTHEVSVSHLAVGDRVVNLSAAHFHDSQTRPTTVWGEPPVPRGRLKIVAPWSQQGSVLCNIAGRISSGGISTHSPDFIENAGAGFPGGLGGMIQGAGWTLEELRSRIVTKISSSFRFKSGRVLDVKYVLQPPPDLVTQTARHEEMISLEQYHHEFKSVMMRGDYGQEREETAWLSLGIPIQPMRAVALDIDEGEVTTVELTDDLTATPWERGEWFAGERVQYQTRVYECLETHFSTYFYQPKPGVEIYNRAERAYSHPYWKEVPSTAAIRPWAGKFFDTDIGRKVIAHGMCRLKRVLLLRSRALTVTADYTWETVRGITLRDSVRLEVPWPHDGTSRVVVGKVIEIRKSWDLSGARATLTLGVSYGDGSDGTTDQDLAGAANVDGYFPPDYLRGQAQIDGHDDIEFVVDADPVPRAIDVAALKSPGYAVREVKIRNTAAEQRSAAVLAGMRNEDPLKAVQELPTRMIVAMRDLTTEGVFKRQVYVAGELLSAPRGIDVIHGEEP